MQDVARPGQVWTGLNSREDGGAVVVRVEEDVPNGPDRVTGSGASPRRDPTFASPDGTPRSPRLLTGR